jgi:hypothetical protein
LVTKSPYLIPPFCKGGKEGIFPFMKGGRERGFERERGNRWDGRDGGHRRNR